jgi:hypothetical protein
MMMFQIARLAVFCTLLLAGYRLGVWRERKRLSEEIADLKLAVDVLGTPSAEEWIEWGCGSSGGLKD